MDWKKLKELFLSAISSVQNHDYEQIEKLKDSATHYFKTNNYSEKEFEEAREFTDKLLKVIDSNLDGYSKDLEHSKTNVRNFSKYLDTIELLEEK